MTEISLPPAYLVELFGNVGHRCAGTDEDLDDEDLDMVDDPGLAPDVFAQLPVAVQSVHAHLAASRHSARVEVSYDELGSIEGVAFFDTENCLLACITTYHLERDDEPVVVPGLLSAFELDEPHRSAALNSLFQF